MPLPAPVTAMFFPVRCPDTMLLRFDRF
jgi:hypothetical protein